MDQKTMMFEAFFFDFDGVILDSVHVKTMAFANMYRQYGSKVEKSVVEFHLANGGVSRFKKFRYYEESLLGNNVSEARIRQLSEKFSSLVVKHVLACSFIPGAQAALAGIKGAGVPTYLVSGTPDNEIQCIVRKKGLSSFFREVHGSPMEKWDIIEQILQRYRHKPNACLFVGDAKSDLEAAYKTDVQFLGIVPEGHLSVFPEGTKISSYIPWPLTIGD